MSELTDRSGWLALADRLRRQAIDVVLPVLALAAAGQVTGIDWRATLGLLLGGSIVTLLTHVATSTGTTLWERLIITVTGSALAVLGTDWSGWLDVRWPAAIIAIGASAAMSLLRSGLAGRVGVPR